jgi:hypothetical protein
MQTEHLVRGLNCSRTCTTRDHATFGECMRAKNQMVGYARSAYGADKTKDRLHEQELNLYRDLRSQGIQPDGTGMAKLKFAERMSSETGMAYGRDFQAAPNGKGGYDTVSHEVVKQVTSLVDNSSDMQVIRETARGG